MSDSQPPVLFETSPGSSREDVAPASSFLAELNPLQLEAVTHRGGHCLVLAGAGSGKTRVLTHRIAWLIAERNIDPAKICAVTFTNKAAGEMRNRVRRLLGPGKSEAWLLTFHAMGLRLLREWTEEAFSSATGASGSPLRDAGKAGGKGDAWLPPSDFTIYNHDASLAVWKQCQSALRLSTRDHDPGRMFSLCSRAVSRLEDPSSWDSANQDYDRRVAGRVWKEYRAAMRAAGAVDFDDLLVLPLHLMAQHPPLRAHTAARFQQLLIDEYQDTNRIQYRLIQTLLGNDSELMVVGDEDQCIYRWRGADLNNVLDFQNDFPGASVVRLEQNYRSTQPILSAAGSLVANNRQRLGKSLWTEREGGESPIFVQCATDREEAQWIARRISEMHTAKLSDIAILYRTHAQSRQIEEVFIGKRIPHRVVGGQRFFARREVRDVLAYLQLLVRDDDLALRRAIATPSRGIGPKTIAALGNVTAGSSAAAALRQLADGAEPERSFREAGFSPAIAERLLAFGRLLSSLRGVAAKKPVADLIGTTIERSGYTALLERGENTDDRLGNLGELASAAKEIVSDGAEIATSKTEVQRPATKHGADDVNASGDRPGKFDELRSFLDRLALLADADTDRDGVEGVRLMTLHAAKGLEFNVVFLAGMEEELFPHATSLAGGDVEEERRLCYVGMTRARQRLFLSAARSRRVNGRERWLEPSRFISEIDPRLIVVRDYLNPRAAGSKDYVPNSFSGLGGRTGKRKRSKNPAYRQQPAHDSLRASPNKTAPVKFTGSTRPAIATDLLEGSTVVHPTFGPGKITVTSGSGEKLKLTVRFRKTGTKTVIAKFAKLEVPD